MTVHDVRAELERARSRTMGMLAGLSAEELQRQVSSLMSPLVWDLAHIGYFEELWLLRELGGVAPAYADHDNLYDAFAHERSERAELPILPPADAWAFVGAVRERVLALLEALPQDGANPLLDDGFVFGMIVQHELQHNETMTQTLQLAGLRGPAPGRPPEVAATGEIHVDGGSVVLGAGDDEPWAYDNERPAHAVELPAFRIDRGLVT